MVTRILDAGATIVGKSHCESLCYSGGSHTNSKVIGKNPHNPVHTAGGEKIHQL